MSSQNGDQFPASEQPMKPIGLQYTCASTMSMWEMLIDIATKRCEELIEEYKQEKQSCEQAEATTDKGKPASGDDSDVDRSLIGCADIAIGGNVTLGDADDEFEESGRLVIDEDSFVEKPSTSGLSGHTPQLKNKEQNHGQRNTVIQPSSSEKKANVASQAAVVVVPAEPSTEGEPSRPRIEVPPPPAPRPVIVQEATSTVRRPSSSRSLRATLSRYIQGPIPVTYNGNMARRFPGAENRTPQQQAVRERNTIAARVSRAKMRMLDAIMKKEQANEERHYQYMQERIAALCMYANLLRGKLKQRQTNHLEQFEHIKKDYVPRPARTHQTRNRPQSDASGPSTSSGSVRKIRKDPTPRRLDLSVSASDTKPNSMDDDSETDSVPDMEETVLDLSSKSSKHSDSSATGMPFRQNG
ncbi:uncharacterized protein LOC109415761 [Aedes albopictus]|uniref:BZIP domain-containing protein n=1 Tax=Aedes albopictus TaxID=7160 RepID=A0ABM1YSF3_AEDAL|nr:uncharacterized protein LOC109415761 [Aedes albopictus]